MYKKLLDKLIRLVKSDYYDVIIEEAGNDTRKLWGILNELIDRKQCRHKMPIRFLIDGQSVRNKKNIANAFNVFQLNRHRNGRSTARSSRVGGVPRKASSVQISAEAVGGRRGS